jgi:hypothetical protein
MSCGDGVGRGAVTCVCKGQAVFEGAVIGQVFTGDVQMQCPQAEHHRSPTKRQDGRIVFKAVSALATVTIMGSCNDVLGFHELVFAYVAIRAMEWMDSRFFR